MAKFDLTALPALLEDTNGKYLEVMGVTASEIVLIGSEGKTGTLPSITIPDAAAKDKLYFDQDGELIKREEFSKVMNEALKKATSQQNSHKGCTRPLPVWNNTCKSM